MTVGRLQDKAERQPKTCWAAKLAKQKKACRASAQDMLDIKPPKRGRHAKGQPKTC